MPQDNTDSTAAQLSKLVDAAWHACDEALYPLRDAYYLTVEIDNPKIVNNISTSFHELERLSRRLSRTLRQLNQQVTQEERLTV